MKRFIFIFLFMILISSLSFAQTDPPSPTPLSIPGDVWIEPESFTTEIYQQFSLEIHANTGAQRLAAYGFWLEYDPSLLILDEAVEGADGFLSSVSANTAGEYSLSGFDASGKGPGSSLHVVTLVFSTDRGNCGETAVHIEILALMDENTSTIGSPQAHDGTVIITGCFTTGDVNNDSFIDIVDALIVAQYDVGLDVSIDTSAADANCDGSVNIVDALLIAQYYVGLVSQFC